MLLLLKLYIYSSVSSKEGKWDCRLYDGLVSISISMTKQLYELITSCNHS